METKILPIIILLFLAGGFNVRAQDTDLPNPGLTPDSPFYFLERIAESVVTFFTFGDIKKAERHVALATERMAEAKAMADKNSFDKAQDKKLELVEKILGKYENQLEKALSRAEKAKNKGKNTAEVANIISEATQKHIAVLEEVLEKVPEQAKPAIEQAITFSTKGSERALEAVSSGEDIELIKAKCLESGGPPQVCSSIEQALQSSKPLQTLCLEQGGAQEMCGVFPSENFRSFEQIKSFCLGQGGPPEMCETLESKCKELGITTADACFRVLSISSVTTYQSAELKVSPTPVLPEEQIQQEGIQAEPEGEPAAVEKKLKQRYIPGVSKVIIYSISTCSHCVKAKEWFWENNIEYENFDISQNEIKRNELMEKIGKVVVPVIEVGDDIIVGFDEEKLSEFFGVE